MHKWASYYPYSMGTYAKNQHRGTENTGARCVGTAGHVLLFFFGVDTRVVR